MEACLENKVLFKQRKVFGKREIVMQFFYVKQLVWYDAGVIILSNVQANYFQTVFTNTKIQVYSDTFNDVFEAANNMEKKLIKIREQYPELARHLPVCK